MSSEGNAAVNPTEWTALAAVVNVAVVIGLAIINILYLRSARRQADAAKGFRNAAPARVAAGLQVMRLLLIRIGSLRHAGPHRVAA